REEQWIGEGVAQSLMLALVNVPGLVQIDRDRLRQLPQPEAWDEAATLGAAKKLAADVALYGEVKRTGTDLIVQPRFLELRGEKVDKGALDTFTVAEGQLLDRLRPLPGAYLKALNPPATDAEQARPHKWAAPTPPPRPRPAPPRCPAPPSRLSTRPPRTPSRLAPRSGRRPPRSPRPTSCTCGDGRPGRAGR